MTYPFDDSQEGSAQPCSNRGFMVSEGRGYGSPVNVIYIEPPRRRGGDCGDGGDDCLPCPTIKNTGIPFQNNPFTSLGAKADIPLAVIFTVPQDGLYLVNMSMSCITADAGATTETMTLNYTDVTTGPQSVNFTRILTATGTTNFSSIMPTLLGGSQVTLKTVLTGAYGVASYDAFASLLSLA